MGFDSREKDGREEVNAAEERLQRCKGNQYEGIRNTGNVVCKTGKGERWHTVVNETQNLEVSILFNQKGCWSGQGVGAGGGTEGVMPQELVPFFAMGS